MQNNFPDKEFIYDHLNMIMFSKGIFLFHRKLFWKFKEIPHLSQKHVMQGKCFSLHLSVKSETKVIKSYQLFSGFCAKIKKSVPKTKCKSQSWHKLFRINSGSSEIFYKVIVDALLCISRNFKRVNFCFGPMGTNLSSHIEQQSIQ